MHADVVDGGGVGRLCGEGSSIAKFCAALRKEAKNADLDGGGAKKERQSEVLAQQPVGRAAGGAEPGEVFADCTAVEYTEGDELAGTLQKLLGSAGVGGEELARAAAGSRQGTPV